LRISADNDESHRTARPDDSQRIFKSPLLDKRGLR
jgi:hypothetical protein